MIRLTIMFAFLATSVWGQDSTDYELYSKIIQKLEGIDNGSSLEILIIAKSLPTENQISFVKEFNSGDAEQDSITSIEEVKICIAVLEKEFYDTPTLTHDGFHLTATVKTLTNREFYGYFKPMFGNRVIKGWKKFYRKHPKAHGIYEFSKIVHNGIYACFYVGYYCNSLCGGGELVIAQKTDGNWKIIVSRRIWVS